MKKFLNIFKISVTVLLLTIASSCTEKENSIPNGIYDGVTNGANLRTIKLIQSTFNFFDNNSKWSVELEEQDAQNGALFQEIKIYVSRTKAAIPASGGNPAIPSITDPEKFIKTVAASTFTPGLRGLPQGKIEVSLQETLTTLGLTSGQYLTSDKFTIRLALVLTDGRIFSSNNSGAQVVGGNYYNSPHSYSVQFFCPLVNAADFNGNYKVTADAWADYSIGDTVPVSYTPGDGYTFKIQNANNTFIANTSTSYNITINPVNGLVTGSSSAGLDYTPSNGVLTNVAITGSVGTCTGDINLKLTFTGRYSAANQTFNLVKI